MAGSNIISDVQITNCRSGEIFEVEYRGVTVTCTPSGAVRAKCSSLQVGSYVDVEVESVRYAEDVETCDGLIISGGESTVIGKLIKQRGIDKVIKEIREMEEMGITMDDTPAATMTITGEIKEIREIREIYNFTN